MFRKLAIAIGVIYVSTLCFMVCRGMGLKDSQNNIYTQYYRYR